MTGRSGWRRLRRGWTPALTLLVVMAAATAAISLQGTRLHPLGEMVADAFQRADPRPYDPSLPVRIVAIDAESLARLGQWPWPRTYMAELIERLNGLGAAVIAFDIVFAEPDRTSPEIVAESARRFEPDAPPVIRLVEATSHDIILSRVIAGAGVVLGAVAAEEAEATGEFQRKYGLAAVGSDPSPRLARYEGLATPLDILVQNAAGYGLAGVGVGEGAVARRAPLFAVVDGVIAPAISLEALRVAQAVGGYTLRSSDASGEVAGGAAPALIDARVGAVEIPLTPDGAMWLRYAGQRPERVVPAWRVLEGDAPDPTLGAAVAGQIVLVGATAPGLRYLVETPLGAGVDAIHVHAEVLEQLLSGVSLDRPDWAPGAEVAAAAVACLIALTATTLGSALVGASVSALLAAGLFGGAWAAFSEADLLLSPVYPALAVIALWAGLTALNFVRSRRESGAVRAQFSRFVAPDVVSQLVDDEESRLAASGDERPLTVMFCDVRGFTTLSETMPPERLIAYLNSVLSAMSEAVLAKGGTVDKYMGDCVMAFWNAPLKLDDHAHRAVAAAFAIRAAQGRLNEAYAAEGSPPVRIGVGINTGPCNVGLMGSSQRLEYSCIGDAVNVASRLQDLTKAYGVWNIVGDATMAEANRDGLRWRAVALDEAAIRGRARTERIWTVLAPADGSPRPDLDRFEAALAEARRACATGEDVEPALARLRATAIPEVDSARLAERLGAGAREPAVG